MEHNPLKDPAWSTNPAAEHIMGRRLTAEQQQHGVIAFDQPSELGYQCPVHREPGDSRLEWSEYRAFLWCERCNVDYPTALCVPMDTTPDPTRPWRKGGPSDAVAVYLATVRDAVIHHLTAGTTIEQLTGTPAP